MVPHSASPPPPEPRGLRPETVTELRAVIAARWRELPGSESTLSSVLARVASEARADGLRPEELIIALKAVEDSVLGGVATLRGNDVSLRQRFREWLVRSCIVAYFSPTP